MYVKLYIAAKGDLFKRKKHVFTYLQINYKLYLCVMYSCNYERMGKCLFYV